MVDLFASGMLLYGAITKMEDVEIALDMAWMSGLIAGFIVMKIIDKMMSNNHV